MVVAVDGHMLGRGLEILADGEDINAHGSQIAHGLENLLARLAQPYHDAGLGQTVRQQSLDDVEHVERKAIPGSARADAPEDALDRFEVVVEDFRPRLSD